ncbi:MAG: hypothetical protein M3Z22_06185 [Verrucomicrobiota bacterium]|nr:hypothetical protein [Verrucomicrobiota bacterium]
MRVCKALPEFTKRAWDAAERALRRKMRQAVVILGVTIRGHDQRWLDFGLNRPQRAPGGKRALVSPAGEAVAEARIVWPLTTTANTDDAVAGVAA